MALVPLPRTIDMDDDSNAMMLSSRSSATENSRALVPLPQGIERTSNLAAPTMQLTGHKGAVFSTKFNTTGDSLASASEDKNIFLWKTFGDCVNYRVLKGHTAPVIEVHWSSDSENIISCSADKSAAIWDVETGTKLKKYTGHSSFINSCCPNRKGPLHVITASDDSSCKLWDARLKTCVHTFPHKYPVTAVAFTDSLNSFISGGIDNTIHVWDIRKGAVQESYSGHTDTITGLTLSPDGSFVLSNSMDCTLRVWDIRPYVPGDRCVKIFQGHLHGAEKNLLKCSWSPDGSKVSCGSADRFVYVWDTASSRILYKLPGHKGSVNEVVFHPDQPIIASGSTDKSIFLGELVEA